MNTAQKDRWPEQPAGYQPAVMLRYPRGKLQIAGLISLALVTPILFVIIGFLQSRSPEQVPLFTNSPIDLLLVVLTVLVTITVHELIHGAAYRLLGYRVDYGVSVYLIAAYAGAFGQWIRRNHLIVTALAPLFVLTGLLFPLLAVQNHGVVLIAFTALIINTAGSVGDLYLVWRLSGMPRATLIYAVDIKTILVFKSN